MIPLTKKNTVIPLTKKKIYLLIPLTKNKYLLILFRTVPGSKTCSVRYKPTTRVLCVIPVHMDRCITAFFKRHLNCWIMIIYLEDNVYFLLLSFLKIG